MWLVPGDFPGLSPCGDLVSMVIPTPLSELERPWRVTWSSHCGGGSRRRFLLLLVPGRTHVGPAAMSPF